MVNPTGAVVEGISFNPETFTEGGGPPAPQNLLVTLAIVKGNYQYVNRDGMPMGNPSCVLELHTTGDDGVQRTQLYSAGPATTFTASEDGKSIIPLGSQKSLAKQSNLGLLLTEVSACGFPAEQLGSDLSVIFQGLYAYFDNKDQPVRAGLTQTPEQAARGPRQISVPTTIHNYPWETSKSPQANRIGQESATQNAQATPQGAPGAAPGIVQAIPTPTPAPAVTPQTAAPGLGAPPTTAVDPAAEALAASTIVTLASTQPTVMAAKNLMIPAAFTAMGQDPSRAVAAALLNDDTWLASHGYVADAAGVLTPTA